MLTVHTGIDNRAEPGSALLSMIQASLLVSLLAVKEVPKSVRLRLLATKGEFTSYQVSSIASIKDQ